MDQRACLVWSPINAIEGGAVEYPTEIAKMLDDCPIYSYAFPPELNDQSSVEFRDFARSSLTAKILRQLPLSQLYINTKYASWKPPAEFDVFVSRGPKAIHTVQRLGQRHVHLFDGSYRGFFLHKDRYRAFHDKPELAQFVIGMFRQHIRTAIQGAIHSIDHVVVNSEWTADVVESLFDREADSIIYPAMPVDSYSPDYRNDPEPYYLYLGVIDEHHRVQEVVEAFDGLPYRLKIAGDGSRRSELEQQASSNVEFCGYVTGEEKRKLLANAEALVNPTNHSFGRVIVESLASGRPVISVNEGYTPYILTDGESGILYDRESESLADAVRRYQSEGVEARPDDLTAVTEKYRRENQQRKWQTAVFDSE